MVLFMKNKSKAQTHYNEFYYETEVGHFRFSVNFIEFFQSDGAPKLAGGTALKRFLEQLHQLLLRLENRLSGCAQALP